jgi:hypothetical protein
MEETMEFAVMKNTGHIFMSRKPTFVQEQMLKVDEDKNG